MLGFVGYFVAEANGLLRTLVDDPVRSAGQGVFDDVTGWGTQPFDVNGLLWGLIGGAALGLVMFLLSAPRQQLARLPLAVLGFTAFGLLTAYAFDDSAYPRSTGRKLLGLRRRRRGGVRADRPLALRAAPLPRSRSSPGVGVGWLVGAWGGADIGGGNFASRSSSPPSCRRRSSASASGSPPSPTPRSDGASISAPAPGSSSRRRWRSSPSGCWSR